MGVEEQRQAFAARLKQAREAKGFTLRQLGEKVDVSFGVLGRMERGLHGAKPETVARLETVLELPAGELGWLLRQVPAPDSRAAEEAIESDHTLSPRSRAVLLATLAALRATDDNPSPRKD